MMAKLPAAALARLDDGTLTREEAVSLCKLLDHPDLLEECLEPNGKRLKARLGAHVPEGTGERAQAVMRALEMDRQRESWAAKMLGEGHRLLENVPKDGDRRYIRLLQGSEVARAHQEGRLSCEAWAWEHGRPVRYCTNPSALQEATAKTPQRGLGEQARQEERRRILEREAARDAVIGAWLATSRSLETGDLGMLARERLRAMVQADERLLARLGGWLGATGDRSARAEVAQRELDNAGERRLIQLWFVVEAAHAMSYSVIPTWLAPWLETLGFADPYGHVTPTGNSVGRVKASKNGRSSERDSHARSGEG
jgi:hypothetical protein